MIVKMKTREINVWLDEFNINRISNLDEASATISNFNRGSRVIRS